MPSGRTANPSQSLSSSHLLNQATSRTSRLVRHPVPHLLGCKELPISPALEEHTNREAGMQHLIGCKLVFERTHKTVFRRCLPVADSTVLIARHRPLEVGALLNDYHGDRSRTAGTGTLSAGACTHGSEACCLGAQGAHEPHALESSARQRVRSSSIACS